MGLAALPIAIPLARLPVPAVLRRDPFYYRNRRQRMLEQQQERQGGMNFLEAIFRWVAACS